VSLPGPASAADPNAKDRLGAVGLGLLGLGNVGAAFFEMVFAKAATVAERTGIDLEIVKVGVREPRRKRRETALLGQKLVADPYEVVNDPEVRIVVELIGGVLPAKDLVLAALAAGKPVVTANKELMATCGTELLSVAEKAGVDLLFEASVAGAIPLIRLLKESLAAEQILRISGIVNGTTNYILTRMSEEGLSYKEALAAAQRLGYAEADPSADVAGLDAAAKAAILAGIAFDADVSTSDVFCEGITAISPSDIKFAHKLGYEVKLLAVAEQLGTTEESPISVRVHPAMLPASHPLASVREALNAVFVEGEAAGEMMVYGRGAGGLPTASAVLGDVIEAAHHLREETRARPTRRKARTIEKMSRLSCQYYLSIEVTDRPGVLAAVAGVFGEHGVSIRSMEQVGLGSEARLVFVTHTAREDDVQATVARLEELDSVERVGCLLRLIGEEDRR
jgi:homoserine dehydrogenase